MRKIKLFALLTLVICVLALTLASCDVVEEVKGKIPGLSTTEETPEHVHDFADATCTAPKTCKTCGETEGKPNGHKNDVTLYAFAPTCIETGLSKGVKCSACGTVTKAQKVLPIEDHRYMSVKGTSPTCTETGLTSGVCCSYCKEWFEAQEVIPANGHTYINGECISCGEAYVPVTTSAWTLTTELKNGDLVLIGAPAYGKLLSAEKVDASSYYNKGVDYSADDFANVTDAEIFVVTVNDDGSYTFTSLTGKVIALAASYSSLNDTGENKTWTLVSKGDGTFLMKNVGRNTYLEWYSSKNNWSTYTAGNTDEYYLSFYVKTEVPSEEGHEHNHITEVTAPTCTEDGYTTYTCACGDTYTESGDGATGHSYADGSCTVCGAEDPAYHVHRYTSTTTATCEAAGVTTYTCSCGDTYTEDTEAFGHVDTNLDITCDHEGCTKRILPAADSKISLFTANHMIIVSLSNNYYVEGVVTEVLDAKNGIFVITDDVGDTILIRLPKNADGVAYASWTGAKIVVGDTISVYGKPTKQTSSTYPQKAKVESGVLTVLNHTHNFADATCTLPATCACTVTEGEPLGHADADASGFCDRCNWNMSHKLSSIAVSTTVEKTHGVLDEGKTSWTWSDDEFNVIIAKGTSTVTLYTTAKDYMQLKKQNTLTVSSKNGAVMHSITIGVTSTTYLTTIQTAIGDQYTFTVDETNLTVTITFDSAEDFVLINQASSTVYVNRVEVVYTPATNA